MTEMRGCRAHGPDQTQSRGATSGGTRAAAGRQARSCLPAIFVTALSDGVILLYCGQGDQYWSHNVLTYRHDSRTCTKTLHAEAMSPAGCVRDERQCPAGKFIRSALFAGITNHQYSKSRPNEQAGKLPGSLLRMPLQPMMPIETSFLISQAMYLLLSLIHI